MGNPSPTRDFSYVDDIVRGYCLLAEAGKPSGIYHFGSGTERSVKEIVETVASVAAVKPSVEWNPEARRVDIPRSVGDSSKASRDLGWQTRVAFADGLSKTVDWYRTELKSGRL